MLKANVILAIVVLGAVGSLVAITAGGEAATAPAAGPHWVAIGAESYPADLGEGFKAESLGISSLVADRVSGDVYLLGWGHGVLRSSDGGKTFLRVDGGKVTGPKCGSHTGYSMQISPLGKKIAVFNMYNAKGPSGYSLDGGATWEEFAHATRDRDFELGAFDWDSKAVLAVPHESNNGLYFSTDAGKTWTQLEKSGGNRPCSKAEIVGLGVLGPKTLLVGYTDRIERSDDAGKSWTKVSDFGAAGQAVRFKEKIWWLTRPGNENKKQGVLTSTDEGKTWAIQGSALPEDSGDVWFGPMFGKDENHIVVAGKKGFFETTDGCKTWKLVTPLPARYDLTWLWRGAAWDPIHDTFYVYNRQKALMKYERAAPSPE